MADSERLADYERYLRKKGCAAGTIGSYLRAANHFLDNQAEASESSLLEYRDWLVELTLSRAIAPILPEYDFVVIDTPPALQVRTINAIAAADDVIVSCAADVSSVAGMDELVERFGQVRDLVSGQSSPSTRHEVRVAGVLITRYDVRNTLEPEMGSRIRDIAEGFGIPVMCANVRSTVSVRKAQRHGMSLRDFAPRATAALDYESVVTQYLDTLGTREGEGNDNGD